MLLLGTSLHYGTSPWSHLILLFPQGNSLFVLGPQGSWWSWPILAEQGSPLSSPYPSLPTPQRL